MEKAGWLPTQMSQSVILWDAVRIVTKRMARGQVRLSLLPSCRSEFANIHAPAGQTVGDGDDRAMTCAPCGSEAQRSDAGCGGIGSTALNRLRGPP
jgi:hypothetical protein